MKRFFKGDTLGEVLLAAFFFVVLPLAIFLPSCKNWIDVLKVLAGYAVVVGFIAYSMFMAGGPPSGN